MADPVTLAAAARYVYSAYSILSGRGGLSQADQAAIRATGAQPFRGVYRLNGRTLSRSEAIALGTTILNPTVTPTPAPAPPPNLPVPIPQPTPAPTPAPPGGGIGRRTPRPGKRTPGGRRAERVPKRPGPAGYDPRQTTPPTSRWEPPPQSRRFPGRIINPNLPYEVTARSVSVLWRVLGAAAGLLYPTPTSATDTILGRPPGSQRGPTQRPRIRPRPDVVAQPQPAPSPDRPARPAPVNVPLGVPQIWQQPIPTPTSSPTSSPRPTSSPTSSPRPTSSPTFNPLWLTPLLFGPGSSGRPRPTVNPFAPPAPTPAPTPFSPPTIPPGRIAPPLTPFNPGSVGSQPNRGNRCKPCRCKQPKKRKRKKREPRRVCYRGTFYETARSTRKFRKEKIRCQ